MILAEQGVYWSQGYYNLARSGTGHISVEKDSTVAMAEDTFSTNEEAHKNNPKTKFYPMKQIVLFTLAVNFQRHLKFPPDPV